MPHYEYLCDEGHEFEVEQRITEDALTECVWHTSEPMSEFYSSLEAHLSYMGKVCGAPCRRQLCKSSFSLKGGGWSGDGYAKSGKG